ncbi:cysteine proteinase [Polyplosphaeria fusca]|uniref:Ubiquitin carboxyl-terminal hydrolase n=1 Tax=Polyplosphaeria fusca TaxID=682080 RepID=A0A9P4UVN0_9PLEO|nr:cysteine proteinase [Polyplosphaeria fusca]
MGPKKMFVPLENNPQVITHLAHSLGLEPSFSFHDIYSLTDPELLAFIPRPCLGLLVIIPMTPTWDEARTIEDKDKPEPYTDNGDPVLWFNQTIGNACGSIGLVHCLTNGEATKHIIAGSALDQIRKEALPKKAMLERAKVLEDSDAFEQAHKEAATMGDTAPPGNSEYAQGQHFVAFVKGVDGHLWELEGGRKGPLDRGALKEDEDCLSAAAVELGLGRLMRIESEKGGDLRFSAIALGPTLT